jgi:hypothetical protein
LGKRINSSSGSEKVQDQLSYKGILIFMGIICGWSLIGNCLEYLIRKENLRHIRAPVKKIERSSYQCAGSKRGTAKCEKTTISVWGNKGEYKIVDYAGRDAYILGVEIGDTIDLYVRKWFQYPLTFGRYESIYILEKDNYIFYTFEDYRKRGIVWIVFGLMGLAVFIPLLYFEINTPRLISEGKLR